MEAPERGGRHPGHGGHQPWGQTGRHSGPPGVDSRWWGGVAEGIPGPHPSSAVTLEKHLHPPPSSFMGSSPFQRLPSGLRCPGLSRNS